MTYNGSRFRRCIEMTTPHDRVRSKFLDMVVNDKYIAFFIDGKIHSATACQSKSHAGVKYNRFNRLMRKLKND